MEGKPLPPRTLEVMARLEQYTPTVPEELVQHCLRRNGDDCDDPQQMRLIALAGEKFLSTVIGDAMQIAKRKQQMSLPMRRQLGYQAPGKKEDKRTVLLTEDITEALTDVGIHIRNASYFVNH
eukprot:gene12132-12270_t